MTSSLYCAEQRGTSPLFSGAAKPAWTCVDRWFVSAAAARMVPLSSRWELERLSKVFDAFDRRTHCLIPLPRLRQDHVIGLSFVYGPMGHSQLLSK